MSTIEMIKSPTTQFKSLVERLVGLPLWVKQAIYCLLKEDLSECSDIELLDSIETKIIQLFEPNLTMFGKQIANNNAGLSNVSDLDPGHKAFLDCCSCGLNLLEISQNNNWTFKQTCEIFLAVMNLGYIDPLKDNSTLNFVMYITGKIRLGEFLVRTNRLTTDRLDKALYAKKCADELGTGLEFKDVLVNLNYLSKEEIGNITSIKASSEYGTGVIDQQQMQADEIMILQDEVDALQFQNKKLEDQLKFYKKELEEKTQESLELTKQQEKYTKGFVGKLLTSLT